MYAGLEEFHFLKPLHQMPPKFDTLHKFVPEKLQHQRLNCQNREEEEISEFSESLVKEEKVWHYFLSSTSDITWVSCLQSSTSVCLLPNLIAES